MIKQPPANPAERAVQPRQEQEKRCARFGWIAGRRRLFALACGITLLAACATQNIHGDAMTLLDQGRYQEAIAKLEEAARQAPGDLVIRKDLIRARELAVARLVMVGNGERVAGRFDNAQFAYEEALRIDPNSAQATLGVQAVAMDRRHAGIVAEAQALVKKGDLEAATSRLQQVFLENANNAAALQLQRQINDQTAKALTATPALRSAFRKPVTLQFRDANLRMVFESISKTTGVNILVDKDVRPDLRVSIFVKDASVEDAIDLLLLQNQLEKKVLSDNTIFVYPNLPLKNKDYQDLVVRTFHLTHADAKQMQAMLKSILKIRDVFVNDKNNSVVMRDTPAAIRLAEKMINDQDAAPPEVMLEVEVLEISHTLLTNLGIQWPDQFTLTGTAPGGTLTLNNFIYSLAKNNVVVSPVPSAILNAHLNDSDANVLASPRIRVRDHEKAKIHVGDRVPVMTNSVTPVATGAPVVTGTVQYLDVGLKLEVEPDIHPDAQVGIKLNMEVSSITQQVTNPVSGSIAYQIGTRTTSTVLSLKDGETQVLAGLIQNADRRSSIQVPGLGQVPVLGYLFGAHTDNATKSEIVLAITPRLVGRAKVADAANMEFWTGTENSLRNAPLVLRPIGQVTITPSTGVQQPVRPAPGAPGAKPGVLQPQSAAPQPMSFTWQGPTAAKVGNRFTLTLNAQSAEPVGGLALTINYDSSVLKAVDAVEGSFLKQGTPPPGFTRNIDQGSGQIQLDVTNAGGPGARGAGSIAALTFEVVSAASQAQISVSRVSPSAVSGQPIDFQQPAPYSVTLNP